MKAPPQHTVLWTKSPCRGLGARRTTATIASHTTPAVTMASYGGVSTSTLLGRPIPSLGTAKQFIAPAMEPDYSPFCRQSGWSPLDSVITLQQLQSDVMTRYPDYQVEPSEPAPNKPTSLGLAKFQQAKPENKPNLPLSSSLEAWLTVQHTLWREKTGKGRLPGYGVR